METHKVDPMNDSKGHIIGTAMGVDFEVRTWSPGDAAVDLSIACMFSAESPGTSLSGGLLHLDDRLGGALTELRSARIFGAAPMETLLITSPPATIRAGQVLVVGLGDMTALTSDLLRQAAATSMAAAIRIGAKTAAFAPSLLDSGHVENAGLSAPSAMLRGAMEGLDLQCRLRRQRLSALDIPRRWTFDAGVATFDRALSEFSNSFDALFGASKYGRRT